MITIDGVDHYTTSELAHEVKLKENTLRQFCSRGGPKRYKRWVAIKQENGRWLWRKEDEK